MKNTIKTTAICLSVFALTACSDWLEPSSPSQLKEDDVKASAENIRLATTGLYADLCSDPYIQLQTIHQGAGTDVELIDGLGATAVNQNNERDGMNYNASTAWTKLGTLWEKQFKTIEDCNRVIDMINSSDQKSDASVMVCSAEARVIRAMVYLDLIRVFGDVPMTIHGANSDLSNVNVGKTDRDVILDALIADLENVVKEDKLPWCGQVTSENVNMGYAKGLLANIYMTRAGYALREGENPRAMDGGYSSAKKIAAGYKDASENTDTKGKTSDANCKTLRPADADCASFYAKAEQHLKDIIDKGIHKMNPSFANEWELINKLELDQTYYENMFEIPVGFGIAGELGYTVGVRMNGATTDWGFQNSAGKLKTTAVMLYSYQPCDTRRDITCIPYEYKNFDRTGLTTSNITTIIDGEELPVRTEEGSAVTAESLIKNKPFSLYIGKWDIRKMSDRWKQQNKTASLKFGYGINTVRMRYPQILLWYAECLAYKGDYSNARNYIKQVHERAYNDAKDSYTGRTPSEDLSDFNTDLDAANDYNSILDKIDMENRLEFCGECFRKWDLIRWNRLHDNIVQAKIDYINGSTQDGDQQALFQRKIYFKYLGEAVKTGTDGKKYYSAPEKQIDWSSATWYGEDGTNKEIGANPGKGWINTNGYRYASNKATDYDLLGFGKDNKDFNGQSYSMNAFGYESYDTRDADLSSICSGLVGTCNTSTGQCDDNNLVVKNRYLMPLENNVLNSSNGRLYNAYGYSKGVY